MLKWINSNTNYNTNYSLILFLTCLMSYFIPKAFIKSNLYANFIREGERSVLNGGRSLAVTSVQGAE